MLGELHCGGKTLDLSQPRVMGVLNVTPDSFSDGGRFLDVEAAVAHGVRLVNEGADIIDVGGESTRPGARAVSSEAELDRVVPVIERLAGAVDAVISIDTMKPNVMRAACRAGAGFINDVSALRAPGALAAARDCAVPVCLMHMQGEPRTMQKHPHYDDVVAEVSGFLARRAQACVEAGLARERLVLDPGFGFGKTLTHNLELFAHLRELAALGYPLLVGVSRKSMLGQLLDAPLGERLHGGVAAAAIAAWEGASIVRVHDVRATRDALRVAGALRRWRAQAPSLPGGA